jgi:hypothetical protein
LNSNPCLDGQNLVGKKQVSYGSNAGDSSISDTNTSPAAGNKVIQIIEPALIPAGEGSNGTMEPF